MLHVNRFVKEARYFVSGQNALIVLPEYLQEQTLIDLAAEASRQRIGVQIVTQAELPFLEQYNPATFNEYEKAGIAHRNSRGSTASIPKGMLELITLQQFIGPLDQLILHKREAIDDKWVQEKSARLEKILISVGDSTRLVLSNGPDIERAKAIRIEALHAVQRLSLDESITSTHKKRSPQTDTIPDDQRFSYTEAIRSRLRENLLGIIAYGSSISAVDVNNIGDFDNFVVVRDVKSAYKRLGIFRQNHFDKPVHLQLIPEATLPRYLAMSYSPARRPDIIKVIDGELSIPTVDSPRLALIGMIGIATSVYRLRKSVTL
jgi:hypothetical protein